MHGNIIAYDVYLGSFEFLNIIAFSGGKYMAVNFKFLKTIHWWSMLLNRFW
jgi:hypothetical protein